MVCKNKVIHGFSGPSWVLITYNICPPVIGDWSATPLAEPVDSHPTKPNQPFSAERAPPQKGKMYPALNNPSYKYGNPISWI